MRAIKTRTARRAALIASTAAAALTAFGASAQTPAIAPPAAPPSEDAVEVEEVVVTAQRRVQALSDVPISVDVVSNAELQRNQIVDLQDLSTYVPNLTVGDTPGENQVSMRGLSTGPRNPLFEQAVTIQVDGIVSARASQFVLPFFDVERVEVLRGPQGVLFGKNATAGAINIVTANPTAEVSGSAAARYEFENQGSGLEGFIAGPITSQLSGRLAVKLENEGGYIQDLNLGEEHGRQETLAARATLVWRPNDALRARLKIDVGQSDRIGNVQQIGACTTNRPILAIVSPTEDCTVNDRTAHTFLGGTFTDAATLSLNVDYEIGDLLLTSITGYSAYHSILERDLDMTPVDAIDRLRDERYQQYSQELRLTSPDEQRLTYIGGVTLQSQRLDIDDLQDLNVLIRPYTNAVTAPFNPALNTRTFKIADQLQTLWSAYLQLTFDATDRLRLIGGARYTSETKEVSYDLLRFTRGTFERRITPLDISIRDRKREESSFDPQLGVQYDFTNRVMGYVTASIVHKGGGFNIEETNGQQVARTFEYDQEEARSVEAGMKAQLRRGLLTLAVFNTDFSDLQVSSFDGVTVFVRNAAEARTRGVEFDGRWRLSEYIDVSGSLAYLDAKFTDYPGGTCTTTEAAAIAPQPCTKNLEGARLTFAPELSANLSLDAEWPLRARVMGQLGATATYKGEHFTQENNDPFFVLPATTRLDAYAGLEMDEGRWTLRLLAKNITDEMPPTFAFPIRGHLGSFGASTPRGREVFIETRVRW